MNALQLSFQDTSFSVIDRNGEPWLKASEIAQALGYSFEDAVSRIYRRNADEFTAQMTQTVKLTVSGQINGLQNVNVRIFSLRGAHLIAMFARTEVAKDFRVWVLDVLDQKQQFHLTATPPPFKPSFATSIQRYQQNFVVTTTILAKLLAYDAAYLLQLAAKVEFFQRTPTRAVFTEAQVSVFLFQLSSLHTQDSNIFKVLTKLLAEFKKLNIEWKDYKSTTPAACPDFQNPIAVVEAWATAEKGRLEEGAARIEVTKKLEVTTTQLEDTTSQLQNTTSQLEAALPAVQFRADVANTTKLYPIDEVAKILGIKPFQLRSWLQSHVFRVDKLPYQNFINQGLFTVKLVTITSINKVHRQTMVTGKGIVWLHSQLSKENIISSPVPQV